MLVSDTDYEPLFCLFNRKLCGAHLSHVLKLIIYANLQNITLNNVVHFNIVKVDVSAAFECTEPKSVAESLLVLAKC